MTDENKNQLVSICLPTFNRGHLIRRAVDSLLAQTYKNFELIISDNASEDDTEKICREYAEADSRIRYFRQEKNMGMTFQFGFLVSKAEGGYFMLAADDDWWHSDFIFKLKKALDEHHEYGVAMSSIRQVHEDGSLVNEVIYAGSNDLSKFNHSRLFNAVAMKNPPAHFFVMGLFRNEILKKLFWKPTEPVFASDRILMYEAALITHFYSVPDILWVRTSSYVPDAKRWTNDYSKISTDKLAYLKHIKAALSRLIMSPNISQTKKLTILPMKILILIWAVRKHIFRELFPNSFRFFKKIL